MYSKAHSDPLHSDPARQTAFLRVLSGSKAGTVDVAIDRTSPVHGFRPVRTGRVLATKLPKPNIRTP